MEGDYDNILMETDYPWCWACGRDSWGPPENWYAPWICPQRAHLASGSGRGYRTEDRRLVCLLCPRCHLLHGRNRIKEAGQVLPHLSNNNMLWLKREFDHKYYDKEYIASRWLGNVPEPEQPPAWFLLQYELHKGKRPAPLADAG